VYTKLKVHRNSSKLLTHCVNSNSTISYGASKKVCYDLCGQLK